MDVLHILVLGAAFSLTAKPVDLIDKNKWITAILLINQRYCRTILRCAVRKLRSRFDAQVPDLIPACATPAHGGWVMNGNFHILEN